MSTDTKLVAIERPETEQTEKVLKGSSWYQIASRVAEACDFTKPVAGPSYASCSFAISYISPKAAEAARQIDRLKSAKNFAEESGEPFDAEGLVSSILLLQNLSSGPIPIPVAGWDLEGGPNLFFSEDGFYGDLEINGKTIEYLLKWNDQQGSVEIYDSEEIEDGRIPPRLLMHLFTSFARANADVP